MNRAVDLSSSKLATDRGVIFAVDDDENDRLHFLRALGDAKLPHGCRMFSAGDHLLDALIEVLRGAPMPVACFVDVKMAGMSGLDVLRWIRAQHGLDALPVVMLSSCDCPNYLAESHQFGAQCYAVKFPAPHELREIVASAERFAAVAHGGTPFSVACNLLLSASAA